MTLVPELPNDVEALKRMIVGLQEQLEAERERHVEELKAAIAAILRRYYGPRSESFDPRQLLLFGQQVIDASLDTASIEEESGEKLKTRRLADPTSQCDTRLKCFRNGDGTRV